jgi:DNA polymerase-1
VFRVPPDDVLLAIDGNSLVHRAFHSQASTGLRSATGEPIWAVRGLLSQIVAAVERVQPSRVIVGFDDPQASARRDRWPQYKAQRTDKLESLVTQLMLARETLDRIGIAVAVPSGWEADDVLASAARHSAEAGGSCVVVTSDRDAFSLIDERTSVLRIINGGVEASPMLTPGRLKLMLGILPAQYRDYAALRGDASDNLPGVRGIGPKTAAKLLCALDTAAAAFDDVAGDGSRVSAAVGAALAARLAEPQARATWELNCAVMAQRRDVELGLEVPHVGALPLSADAVHRAFEAFQLPWTTRSALRALAHVQTAVAAPSAPLAAAGDGRDEPRGTEAPHPVGLRGFGSAGRAREGRGVARLPQRAAAAPSAQLSLFD